jgi:twinkle protein
MKIGGILVRPDNPEYLESHIEAQKETFSLANVDVADLQQRMRARRSNFTTAPFDPEGKVLRFFPGGFSIWSGHPGAGKTTILRQLACHLMACNQRVFVCSLEEDPEDVFTRHAEVALGDGDPSALGLQWCAGHWVERLKLWNYWPGRDDAQHQRILAAIRVLAKEGVRHAIIDSFMCLDVPSNDWEAQRLFTKSLAATCQLAGVHVHLVAHPRKPAQNAQEMDIGDVAGSSDLGRKADNVLFVKRATNEDRAMFEPHLREMRINIRKQRYGTGHIGETGGFFNTQLRQFVIDQFQTVPTRYLPETAYEDCA